MKGLHSSYEKDRILLLLLHLVAVEFAKLE